MSAHKIKVQAVCCVMYRVSRGVGAAPMSECYTALFSVTLGSRIVQQICIKSCMPKNIVLSIIVTRFLSFQNVYLLYQPML